MPFDSNPDFKRRAAEYKTPPPEPSNHYEVLGLTNEATTEEVEKAYRKLLIGGLHEDRIAAMPEGEAKFLAQTKLEAAKEALKVLGNPRNRARYDQELSRKPEVSPRSRSESYKSPEESSEIKDLRELLNLTRAKLELATDKANMEAIINEFNSKFTPPNATNVSQFKKEIIVSVPEGDYQIFFTSEFGNQLACGLTAAELPPYKMGNMVKVKRSGGEIEDGWVVSGFEIKDTTTGPERVIIVSKIDEYDNGLTKKVYARDLRKYNS